VLATIFILGLTVGGIVGYRVAIGAYVGDVTDVYVYPPFSEASYVVGLYNSTHYYAKNGTTGNYDVLSTNASYVLLSVIGDNISIDAKAGMFYFDTDILIPYRNFQLIGAGAGLTTFCFDADSGITFTRSASATFRLDNLVHGITFDGQGLASYGIRSRCNASGNLILFNFEVSNCEFKNFNVSTTSHALDLTGLEESRIIFNTFATGTKGSQIYLWEDGTYESGNILIFKNYIVTTDNSANGAIGILINCTGTDIDDSGVGAVSVQNNHFLGDTKLSVGVYISCETKTSTKNFIIHNRAEGCDLVHFYDLNASCYNKYTEVADNLIVSSYGSECNIKLGLHSTMIQVHDNVISNQNSSSYFIQDWGNASSTQWNRVYDNAFTGTAKFGLGIYTEVRNNMGLNPLGVQSGNFRSDSSISFHGTYSNWANGTTYRLVTTDMFLSVSGGTGVNITITDPNGVLFKADLSSDNVYLIPWRYKFSITYATLPTVVFAWK
jgi:hypothetical protein